MAKISALTAITQLGITDQIPLVQSGTTKHMVPPDWGLVAVSASNRSYAGPNAAGATLTLLSTEHATKGKVVLGTASAYDQVNDRLGLGTTAPGVDLDVAKNLAGGVRIRSTNASADAAAFSDLTFGNNTSASAVSIRLQSSASVAMGGADSLNIYHGLSAPVSIFTAGTNRLHITGAGNSGFGTAVPKNKLDIAGAAVIGATYAGTNTAPTNGLLVQGNVGIGLVSPTSLLHTNSADVRFGNSWRFYSTSGALVSGNLAEPTGSNAYVLLLATGASGTHPTFSTGGGVYARVVSAVDEVFARDSAGNATQLSPHHPDNGEWIFHHHTPDNPRGEIVYMERLLQWAEKSAPDIVFRESCNLGCEV